MGESELCAFCGEPAGPRDWADRQWGRIDELGPGGVLVTRHVHSHCYLHHAKSKPGSTPLKLRPQGRR